MQKFFERLFCKINKHHIVSSLTIFLFVSASALLTVSSVSYQAMTFSLNSLADNFQPKKISDAYKENKRVKHINQPDFVKGIYLTSHTAGSYRFDELLELVKNTELNTMVIDVQDTKGNLAFQTLNNLLLPLQEKNVLIKDLDGLVKKAHNNNVYLIGRVVVFQNPALVNLHPEWAVKNKNGGVWKDYKGISWLDAACRSVWDLNIALAKELYNRGFDEINFDYIRFPSDGNISSAVYPCFKSKNKAETIREFFNYLNVNLKNIPISVDLFGQTCCNLDDINIGQMVIHAYENLDAICQMMYPSHYYTNFIGFKNPAEHPYEVVKYSLDKTFEKINNFIEVSSSTPKTIPLRKTQIRPWIQAFSLGAVYTPEMIRRQMQAIYDTPNTRGWLLWNARNIYSNNIFLSK